MSSEILPEKEVCSYVFANNRKISVSIIDHEYDTFCLNFLCLDEPGKDMCVAMRPDEVAIVISLLGESLFKAVKGYTVEILDKDEHYGKSQDCKTCHYKIHNETEGHCCFYEDRPASCRNWEPDTKKD
jgi:hypothetical protein